MSDASQFGEYNTWAGRKRTALTRTVLDCGCPNAGEVFFHLWCDRLACAEHANDRHECGEYAGVKSGTEEVSEPGQPAAPTWTVNPGVDIPRANVCRNCGSLLALNVPLCPPCEGLPPCNATRWAAIWGATAMCLLPAGHDGRDHESVEGWKWQDRVYQVEAVRLVRRSPDERIAFLRGALNGAVATGAAPGFVDGLRLALDQAQVDRLETLSLECGMGNPLCSGCDGLSRDNGLCQHECHDLEPDAHPVDASSDTAPDVPRKSKISDLYAALRARARRGGTK